MVCVSKVKGGKKHIVQHDNYPRSARDRGLCSKHVTQVRTLMFLWLRSVRKWNFRDPNDFGDVNFCSLFLVFLFGRNNRDKCASRCNRIRVAYFVGFWYSHANHTSARIVRPTKQNNSKTLKLWVNRLQKAPFFEVKHWRVGDEKRKKQYTKRELRVFTKTIHTSSYFAHPTKREVMSLNWIAQKQCLTTFKLKKRMNLSIGLVLAVG